MGFETVGCGLDEAGECVKCREGTYKSNKGFGKCVKCSGCESGFVRRECGGASSGKCVKCEEGTYEENGSCVKCEACAPGFVRQSCGGASPGSCSACPSDTFKSIVGDYLTKCKPVTPVRIGENYETKPATLTSDRELETCSACGLGGNVNEDNLVKCAYPHCDACTHAMKKGVVIALENAACAPLEGRCVVKDGFDCYTEMQTFESVKPTMTSDRVCDMCDVCVEGEYESKKPTLVSDRVCAKCESCPAGKVRKECGGDSPGKCVECAEGSYEENGSCVQCKGCSSGFVRSECGGPSPGKCVACEEGMYELSGSCEKCRMFLWLSCRECARLQWRVRECPEDSFESSGSCAKCEECSAGSVRMGCFQASPGKCVACGDGTYEKDGSCVKCSECSAGLFVSAARHPQESASSVKTASIAGGKCVKCGSVLRIVRRGGQGFRRKMRYLEGRIRAKWCLQKGKAVHLGKTYELKSPTATTDRQCAPITICNYANTFESQKATLTADTVCSTLNVCDGVTTFERREDQDVEQGVPANPIGLRGWIMGVKAQQKHPTECAKHARRARRGSGVAAVDHLQERVACSAGTYSPGNGKCVEAKRVERALFAKSAADHQEESARLAAGTYKTLADRGARNAPRAKVANRECFARIAAGGLLESAWLASKEHSKQRKDRGIRSALRAKRVPRDLNAYSALRKIQGHANRVRRVASKLPQAHGIRTATCALRAVGKELIGCGGKSKGDCRDCPMGLWADVSDFLFGAVIDCGCTGCSGCGWRGCSGCSGCGKCAMRPKCAECASCPKGFVRVGCGSGSKGSCVAVQVGEYKDTVGDWTTKPKACQPCEPGFERVGCGGCSQGTCVRCEKDEFKSIRGSWNAKCEKARLCSANLEYETKPLTSTQDRECKVARVCLASEFETRALTSTQDRACKSCDVCGDGEYEHSACGATLDRECRKCLPCAAGMYRSGCRGNSRGECLRCPANSYKLGVGSWDTKCAECADCPKGKMRSGCYEDREGACEDCAPGKYKSSAGSSVCSECGTCGIGQELVGCGGGSPGQCVECGEGTYKEIQGAWSSVAPASRARRICSQRLWQNVEGQVRCLRKRNIQGFCWRLRL